MSIGDFAATTVKQTPLANKWLPSICGALGGLLGLAAMYINVPDFPAADPLTALAVGIVSGLAATGADQVIKQIGKGNWPESYQQVTGKLPEN